MRRLTRNQQSSWQHEGHLQASMLLPVQRVNAGTGVSLLYEKFEVRFITHWMTVCLEHLYHQRGLLVRRYPCRGNALSSLMIIWYELMLAHHEETVTVGPAPTAPQSQSSAARKLQDVEKCIGSIIDQVTQSPGRSGRLISRWSLLLRLTYSPTRTTIAVTGAFCLYVNNSVPMSAF
jgi:hypothetical protein